MGNKTWKLQQALHRLKAFEDILDVPGGGVLYTHRGHHDKLSLCAGFNRGGVRVENDYPLSLQGLRNAFKAMDPNSDYSYTIRQQ